MKYSGRKWTDLSLFLILLNIVKHSKRKNRIQSSVSSYHHDHSVGNILFDSHIMSTTSIDPSWSLITSTGPVYLTDIRWQTFSVGWISRYSIDIRRTRTSSRKARQTDRKHQTASSGRHMTKIVDSVAWSTAKVHQTDNNRHWYRVRSHRSDMS